jgi:hypothetical protein
MKKRQARAAAAAVAQANRALHGRTAAQKAADRLAREKAASALDQAQLDEKPISR